MNEIKFITTTAEQTTQLAEKLATALQAGDVITLKGDLGAGKTTFTKGLGAALGVKRTINSPTFTIVKTYQGNLPLYHMDVYRLEDSDEDIGFEEYFDGDGVSVVEWPQFIESYLPEERLDIVMNKIDDNQRSISFSPIGNHFTKVCEELAQ